MNQKITLNGFLFGVNAAFLLHHVQQGNNLLAVVGSLGVLFAIAGHVTSK